MIKMVRLSSGVGLRTNTGYTVGQRNCGMNYLDGKEPAWGAYTISQVVGENGT